MVARQGVLIRVSITMLVTCPKLALQTPVSEIRLSAIPMGREPHRSLTSSPVHLLSTLLVQQILPTVSLGAESNTFTRTAILFTGTPLYQPFPSRCNIAHNFVYARHLTTFDHGQGTDISISVFFLSKFDLGPMIASLRSVV